MIPVVFLHGIGGGAKSFAPQIASFARVGYHPVALDLPGYGGREPVETMSFDALAEDVETNIAGLERPVLVGGLVLSFEDETVRRRSPDDGCLHRRARLLIPRRAEPARRVGATLDQAEAANVVDGL